MSGRGERFARHLRLLKPAEYRRVFANPCKSSDANFTVLAIRNGLFHARLGMAISRKQAATAVERNRVKRMIRESFRRHQRQLPPLDIVVLARRGTAQRSGSELLRSLEQHWVRIGRRCAA